MKTKVNSLYVSIFSVTVILLLRQLYYFGLISKLTLNSSLNVGMIFILLVTTVLILAVLLVYVLPVVCAIKITLNVNVIRLPEVKVVYIEKCYNRVNKTNFNRRQVLRC